MTIRKIWRVLALTGAVVASLALASTALAARPRAADAVNPGAPAPPSAPAECTDPTLSQQFLAFGDANQYALVPGGSFNDPSGGGWQFSGDASIVNASRPDGTYGGVLSLPGGSSATSPVTCVTSDYPTARMWIQNTGGDGVHFRVSYWKTDGTWSNPKETGQGHGPKKYVWGLSTPLNVQPANSDGWQYVKFTLVGGGDWRNSFQVDDFYVDPRSSR